MSPVRSVTHVSGRSAVPHGAVFNGKNRESANFEGQLVPQLRMLSALTPSGVSIGGWHP